MRKYTFKRFHVDFQISELTDDKRDELIAGIAKVAPNSTLIQGNPALLTSANVLVTKGTAFKTSRATAAGSRTIADADEAKANLDRIAVDAELLSFTGLVEANARSAEDVKGSGVPLRPPPAPKSPFAPPDSIDITFPKKEKGKFHVSPHGVGKSHDTWLVQMSSDPVNPTTWVDVYGTGKSRTLIGASGTSVWIRYAMVRDEQKSAWSTPVLVTYP